MTLKIYLILIFTTWTTAFFSQQNNSDIIIWCDTAKLTWNDFTKIDKTPGLPGWAATTYKYYHKDTCINGRLFVLLYTWFTKSKSWVIKTKVGDEELLEHERLHFDIAELWARKCRMKIAFIDKTCQKSNYDEIMKTITECNEKQMEENLKYDEETNHYHNKDTQKKWEKRIKYELDAMKQWTYKKGIF